MRSKRTVLTFIVFCILSVVIFAFSGFVTDAESEVTKVYTDGIGTGAVAELWSDGTFVVRPADGYTEARLTDYKSASSSQSARPFASDLDSIKSIKIESGITYIGAYFFKGISSSLTHITLSDTVTKIGSASFTGVTAERVDYEGTMSEWLAMDVSSSTSLPLSNAELYIDGCLVRDVIIPEDVSAIKQYAFFGSTSVRSLTVHNSVSEIGKGAFNECSSLLDITIPSDITLGASSLNFSSDTKLKLTASGSVASPSVISVTNLYNMTAADITLSSGDISFGLDETTVQSIISSYGKLKDPLLGADVKETGNTTSYNMVFRYSDGSEVYHWNSAIAVSYQYKPGLSEDEVEIGYTGEYESLSYDPTSGVIAALVSEPGILTVTADDIPMPSFVGAYLNLNENINLVYRVSIPDIYTSFSFTVSFNGKEYTLSPSSVGDGAYDFRFTGIMPYQMNDNISATVTATAPDGSVRSVTHENMSVRRYYELVTAYYPDDTALITLVSDLLYYGECAQIYRDYKTDELVTEGLSLKRSEYATPEDVFTLVGENESIKWSGAGLYCADNMGMYFKATSNREDISVRITHSGREKTYRLSDITPDADGRYEIVYMGIQAYEFGDTVTAELIDDKTGEVLSALTYSVGTYVRSMENYTDGELANLVRAIQCYGSSAKAYR